MRISSGACRHFSRIKELHSQGELPLWYQVPWGRVFSKSPGEEVKGERQSVHFRERDSGEKRKRVEPTLPSSHSPWDRQDSGRQCDKERSVQEEVSEQSPRSRGKPGSWVSAPRVESRAEAQCPGVPTSPGSHFSLYLPVTGSHFSLPSSVWFLEKPISLTSLHGYKVRFFQGPEDAGHGAPKPKPPAPALGGGGRGGRS